MIQKILRNHFNIKSIQEALSILNFCQHFKKKYNKHNSFVKRKIKSGLGCEKLEEINKIITSGDIQEILQ